MAHPTDRAFAASGVEPVSRLDPDGLQSLALQCERMEGPSRELDGEIDRLFNDRPNSGDVTPEGAVWRIRNNYSGLAVRYDGFARDGYSAQSYTNSLDAALTLLPAPDWEYSLQWEHGSLHWRAEDGLIARVEVGDPMLHMEAEAATPALAMCAAALRARAHLIEQPPKPRLTGPAHGLFVPRLTFGDGRVTVDDAVIGGV